MNSSLTEIKIARAERLVITGDTLAVDLDDGKTISFPLNWYPRILHGTEQERNDWRFIGKGERIHWPDLDENISIIGLLAGNPSGESGESLAQWLEARKKKSSGQG